MGELAAHQEDGTMPISCDETKNEEGKGNDVTDESFPVPPDGGWGWVVCLGCFMAMVMLDGVMFTFGVFFLELQSYFGESKGRTALVGSALMGSSLMMGPFVSVLVNAFGIRIVAMSGALICSLSFALSTLATDITILTITYGFLGGLGICMVYLPSIIAVGFYFEKRRALANGITSSGSGIGTFIYSPLCNYLQSEYGWKGALLIISAITLNCVACGALYLPIEKSSPKQPPKRVNKLYEEPASRSEDTQSLLNHSRQNPWVQIQKEEEKSLSYHHIPRIFSSQMISSKSTPILSNVKRSRASHSSNVSLFSRKDLLYTGSLMKLPEYQVRSGLFITSDKILADSEDGKCPQTICDTLRRLKRDFVRVTGFGLLTNPVFLLIMLCFVLWTTHMTILTLLPDYATHQPGVTQGQAALLISIIGASNTAARLLAGWLTNMPYVDSLWVNAGALLLGGVTCLTMPFSHQYLLLAFEAAVFGICMGTWTSLRPIIIVELLGLDQLTNALGLVALFQGLAFTIGPLIAGTFYDYIGSYTPLLLLAGTAFLLSGFLCCLLKFVASSRCLGKTVATETIEISS